MRICLVVVMVVSWLAGCRQDGSVNGDLLYRRWRLFRVQYANSGQAVDTPTAEWTITEFKPNGTILYGTNGRYTACCSPNRFKREGMTLDLTDVASIPIPETDNPGACAAVDCATPGASWQIVLLNQQSLTINTANGVNYYQPY